MKNKRTLIIAAVVIALLAVGIFVINGIDTDKKEPQIESAQTNTVYKAEASELAEVKVVSESGEIRAINKGKSDWTINDLPEGEIDPQKAYSLAGTVSTIISKNKYDAPADLSEYGLDNPAVTVTITKKNGETDTVYIGDLSPVLGEYFIMLDGDSSVYTLYSYKVDSLLKPLSYYKEFDRFNINIDDITGVRIEQENGTIDLRLKDKDKQSMANVWEMTEPYEVNANDDYIDNKILAPIEDISLTNPIEDTAFKSNPSKLIITVRPFNSENGKYDKEYTETLLIGDTNGSLAQVKYDDKIYETPASSVDFVNENAFNIASKMQALVDISLVKSVTVEYGDEKHVMDIKQSGGKYTFMLDGKETDAKISQEIYRNIIGIPVDALYSGDATKETVLKLTFDGIKDSDDTVVEFKQFDDLNSVMERNGEAQFTAKTSKLREFITLFDAYVKSNE